MVVGSKWWKNGVCIFSFGAIKGFVYCILHVCGGDPMTLIIFNKKTLYSPRMWRWSWFINPSKTGSQVFSTYVEVILGKLFPMLPFLSILHVCGGDPNSNHGIYWELLVFSTYVEVILHHVMTKHKRYGILHVCGGDPVYPFVDSMLSKYSPRMWRWS